MAHRFVRNTVNSWLGILGTQGDSQQPEQRGSLQEPDAKEAVDLIEDEVDNAEATVRQAINPAVITPTLPPRSYHIASGSRTRITDPYPEPPPARRSSPPVKQQMSGHAARKPTDREEEERLLGTSKTPKNATLIPIPGSDEHQPTSMRVVRNKKPGSDGNFLPKNTLDYNRFQSNLSVHQSSARASKAAGAKRANLATAQMNAGLETATSRGQNVTTVREADFPDERKAKKQKTEHIHHHNNQVMKAEFVYIPPRSPSHSKEGDSDLEVREAKSSLTAPKSTQNHHERPANVPRLRKWEVSGLQESRHIEEMTNLKRRPSETGTKSAYFLGDVDTSAGRLASSRPSQVVERAINETNQTKRRGRPPLNKSNGSAQEISDNADTRVHKKSRANNSALSDYMGPAGPKERRKAPVVVDLETTNETPKSALAMDVRNVLGPPNSKKPETEESLAPRSPVRKLPEMATTEASSPNHVASSGDEDELHGNGDIPASFPRNVTAANRGGLSSTKKIPTNRSWAVETLVDERGMQLKDFDFLQLDIDHGFGTLSQEKRVRLRKANADGRDDNLRVVNVRHIRGVVTSEDPNCRILRLKSMLPKSRHELLYDIEFRDNEVMMDFLAGLKNATTLKDVNTSRPADYMLKVWGKRSGQTTSIEQAVDQDIEHKLLAKRGAVGDPIERHAASRFSAAGRPREAQTLVSQLRVEEPNRQNIQPNSSSARTQKQPMRQSPEPLRDSERILASARPLRATRAKKPRSPSPEVSFKRFSKEFGLGPAWDQPVVYPEVGKKRVTIDFKDLERLDEGEFLNDNLIEFYVRWLQETRPVREKTAYFFGTHFYSTLSDTAGVPKDARNRIINYNAVERWTAKDDIFSYDYVVVPINEMAHWYLAIICNLPKLDRKLEGQVDVDMVDASKVATVDEENGTPSHPVTIPEAMEITPTRPITQQCEGMALFSSKLANAQASDGSSPAEGAKVSQLGDTVQTQDRLREQERLPSPQSAQQDSQMSEGVFANAAPASPDRKKKGRRKSGPGPRKYNVDQPAIVVMDPMHAGHAKAIATLKEYLVEEASSKRGMAISKDMFQGINAKSGIPQQDNYYDCGIYVCGYLDKFMQGPEAFGRKMLLQEFDLEEDWPEMKTGTMRNHMREMLQKIAKEQQEARQKKKAEKRALKKQNATPAVGSPPVAKPPVSANETIDLSSPVKPRMAAPQPEPAADVSKPLPELANNIFYRAKLQASPPNQGVPARASLSLTDSKDEDVMLFDQRQEDMYSQLQAAANGEHSVADSQDMQHVSDSESEVEREVSGGKTAVAHNSQPNIEIYEDSSAGSQHVSAVERS